MSVPWILRAAAELIEREDWDQGDVSLAIQSVSGDPRDALAAIRFFSTFVRSDGIAWEREPGRTQAEVVRALRDAADVAS